MKTKKEVKSVKTTTSATTAKTRAVPRTVKTKFKPAFVVDLTDCETAKDVKLAFIYAKIGAEQNVTFDELVTVVGDIFIDTLCDFYEDMFKDNAAIAILSNGDIVPIKSIDIDFDEEVEEIVETIKQKPNVFKRFWNWITRK